MKRTRLGRLPLLALAATGLAWGCTEAGVGPVQPLAQAPAYVLVADRAASAGEAWTASRRIGPAGGVFALGAHELVVPAGAVSGPTVFQVQVKRTGSIQVDLEATADVPGARQNGVGAAGFARPLTLRLSYRGVADSVDPATLAVVWVREDGALVPLPGTVDRRQQRVEARVDHFSGYALASNRSQDDPE
jgi:hypothetical protein